MAYGTLLSFHLYLIKQQFGTYDFLIERAAQRREKKKGIASTNDKVSPKNQGTKDAITDLEAGKSEQENKVDGSDD